MTQNSLRAHPLMVITATTLILTCLIAIGVMTGIVPSPNAKERAAQQNAAAPAAQTPAPDYRQSARAPSTAAQERERTAAPRPPGSIGSTSSSAAGGTVAGTPPSAPAVCNNCGTVTSVRAVKQQGEAGLVGPIAGGAVGGLVGSQIGSGSGKTIATIVGAAGGAAVGTEAERRYKSSTSYVVGVRLNDGTSRSFTYANAPGVERGDKVRVVDGRLQRDS
jgi:outer membrane lipoprotein SlyB